MNNPDGAAPLTDRAYEGEHDLVAMLDLLMEARAQTNDWRYAHVGELLFRFLTVARHLDAHEYIRLWHAQGRLVAYALLGEDPLFDWQVLPEWEWRGIEEQALAWAQRLLEPLRPRDPARWGGALVSGARRDDLPRRAFLERNGFQPGGEFSEVNMLCRLDQPLPASELPPGCVLRSVLEPDLPARAEAHRVVWLPWTDGEVSDEDYAFFARLPGYRHELDLIAVAPDGVIAAFVNGWLDTRNGIGDLGPVGAHPEYRRQGFTRAVLYECLRRMQAAGMLRACVSTGVSNTAAIRLYTSVGFQIVNQYDEYQQAVT